MCDQVGCEMGEDYQHRRDSDAMEFVDVRKDDLEYLLECTERVDPDDAYRMRRQYCK